MTAPLPSRQDPAKPAPPPSPGGPAPAGTTPGHRSLADGELATPWSLQDFFSNVNSVLRLPARPRPAAAPEAPAASGSPGLALPSLAKLRIPKGALVGGALIAIGYFGVWPLLLSATAVEKVPLAAAQGVWMAEGGRYGGRMFELGERTIAFRTSKDSPDYTWHKIVGHRTQAAGDSVLFTVTYVEGSREAEFAFWLIARRDTVVRLQHQAGVVWKKTPLLPQRM